MKRKRTKGYARFCEFLSKRSEHIMDEILKDITPCDSIVGYFEMDDHFRHGIVQFWSPYDVINYPTFTFEQFNQLHRGRHSSWSEVASDGVVGKPVDP